MFQCCEGSSCNTSELPLSVFVFQYLEGSSCKTSVLTPSMFVFECCESFHCQRVNEGSPVSGRCVRDETHSPRDGCLPGGYICQDFSETLGEVSNFLQNSSNS